jgi:hypothetical protein
MASVSRQIGWSQESNLLYQILKQLTRLTSVIFKLNPKYKVYTVTLTQSGENNPPQEEVVLENTIGILSWAYEGTGIYALNSADLFTDDKTFINGANFVTPTFNFLINEDGTGLGNQRGYFFVKNSSSKITLRTSEGEVLADDIISNPICIEIRVYN